MLGFSTSQVALFALWNRRLISIIKAENIDLGIICMPGKTLGQGLQTDISSDT